MVNDIGECAGKLWHYLLENPSSAVEDASKSLKMKDNLVSMAVGWLAREDKLVFEPDGKGFRLSVRPEL